MFIVLYCVALVIERAASPDNFGTRVGASRAKMRRSRSACDIRDMRPIKRTDSTLAPIPAKSSRMMTGNTVGNTGILSNKPPRIGTSTTNNNTAKRPPPGNTSKPNITGRAAIAAQKQPTGNKPIASAGSNVSTTGAGKPINKRIPPYDFKARYNDLLEKHKILKEKLEEKTEQIGNLENLPELLEDTQTQLISTQDELKNAQTMNECLQRQTKLQQEKFESVTENLCKTTEELEKLTKEYNVRIPDKKCIMRVVQLKRTL